MTDIGHVVVVGASVAGLTAAAALAGHAERITVVDRDELPAEPANRAGTPQTWHLHSLMAAGQQALESLLPGVLDDLVAAGAVPVSAPEDNLWLAAAGWCTRFPGTHTVPSASRDLLDWVLRRRVAALPGVTFATRTEITGLCGADGTITGVRTRDRDTGATAELAADLVVDASGRSSRTPAHLTDLGYAAPRVSVVDSRAAYSSRFYRIPAEFTDDWRCISIGNDPPATTRGGALIEVDGGRWLVSLFGYLDDHPPTDEDGFLEFAASLRHPVLHEVIRKADPAGPIRGYAKMSNQRRHYEELPEPPTNLVVVGDALCALNPVYAQGMSVAAMTAVTLREHATDDSATIQRALAPTVDRAWAVAVGADHALLTEPGTPVDDESRRVGEYMDRVLRLALADPFVNKIFFDVMMMVEEPARLFAPDITDRVGQGPARLHPADDNSAEDLPLTQ